MSSPCTTLLAARVPPRQVPWPVTAEAVSTSLQKALRVVFMLTMFGARGHYNGIGLAPGRPGRPVVTAMGGAGRSFGIHRAMLQHVDLGCVSPQAWGGLHEQAGQNSVSAGRARLVWPLSLSWPRLQLFLTSPCHFGGASGSYCEVDIRVSCLSASPRGPAWADVGHRGRPKVGSCDQCRQLQSLPSRFPGAYPCQILGQHIYRLFWSVL